MKKFLIGGLIAIITILAIPVTALAHVVVTPDKAGVATRTLFNVSVPNEEDVAVTSIKLLIPGGVSGVQPTVAAGWEISTEKNGDEVTSITWSGAIPAGQRADLTFKGQTPAKTTELDWKAYQTYANGKTVNWDQKPTTDGHGEEGSTSGPYSVTDVINDIDNTASNASNTNDSGKANAAFALSIAALALSMGALFIRRKNN